MNNQALYILAIESSCDDTSVAVLKDKTVLSNIIANQEVHRKYGGVIPELASRSHEKNILPVVKMSLQEADVNIRNIDAIAFTQGPGLPGSLIVANSFAKSMAMALKVPLIGVNHMQAHILAHFIDGVHEEALSFPFLCLTVSGGHTQLVLVKDHFDMQVVGSTLDDAAGEAFDKIAKMLGLEYPGGPLIDKLAREGNSEAFDFPKPKVNDFDYSFSGLKTSVLYFLKKKIKEDKDFIKNNINDLAASIQKVIIDVLMETLTSCAEHYNINQIAVAGGVSANSFLRQALKNKEEQLNWKTYVPPIQYCTDNAAMIGITGYFKYQKGEFEPLNAVSSGRLYL